MSEDSGGEPGGEGRPGRRVVLATVGTLGDLNPFLAVALGLKARGHDPVVATHATHRAKVERLGLRFHAVRPDHPDWETRPELTRRMLDPLRGHEWFIRDFLMPSVRESYEDTLAASAGADLMVSHAAAYTVRLVSEKTGVPWASAMLSPQNFYSAHDPPVLPVGPVLSQFGRLGPSYYRWAFRMIDRTSRPWAEPLRRLRAGLGLPPPGDNPVFKGWHSPRLVLALFSRLVGGPQPDWPPNVVVTGFPSFDGGAGLSPELTRFLDGGPPPVVFTLGASASLEPGSFFDQGAEAARRLGLRAVLAGAAGPGPSAPVGDGVMAVGYAPYSALFPRAAVVVHHGGVGTSELAFRAGRPALVVPFAFDNFDNALRATRLGVARTLPRRRLSPARLAAEVKILTEDPAYARRAAEVASQIRQEDGVGAACDALEGLLRGAG